MKWLYLPNCVTFVRLKDVEQIIKHRDGKSWEVWMKGLDYEEGDVWEVCEPKIYKKPFKGV